MTQTITSAKELQDRFIISGFLESLVVRRITSGWWQVFLLDGRGSIEEYNNREIVEKVNDLLQDGWKINKQKAK